MLKKKSFQCHFDASSMCYFDILVCFILGVEIMLIWHLRHVCAEGVGVGVRVSCSGTFI